MKNLLKIFKIVLYILIAIIGLVSILYYLDVEESTLINGYYKDYGSGVTIKSENNENLFIGGVLEIVYDKQYILAKVFPRINYECKGYITQRFITKIKYLIIDTKNNKVYGTDDFNKFKKKINNLNILIKYDMTNKELNKYINNNYNWFYQNNKKITNTCKEDNFYLTKIYVEL